MLVPIRVRVYRRTADLDAKRKAGQADYPPFNELPDSVRRGLPWSVFFQAHGSDWIAHDQVENLGTGHDYGQWVAMVPEDFAEAAHDRWPHLVEILDEDECEQFYDQRCATNQTDETMDDQILDRIYKMVFLEDKGIKAQPSTKEIQRRRDALDPTHKEPGAGLNPRKNWKRFKASQGWGTRVKPSIAPKALRQPPQGWVSGRGK